MSDMIKSRACAAIMHQYQLAHKAKITADEAWAWLLTEATPEEFKEITLKAAGLESLENA